MKLTSSFLFVLLLLFTSGCSTLFSPGTSTQIVQAVENPNNIAKAVQGGVHIAATAFLARNGVKYGAEVQAAADAFTALAASNPSSLTGDDIAAALKGTGISVSTQTEIASYATSGLGEFLTDFQVSFPTLKPNIAIYLQAVANGLNLAAGKVAVPLPVIPYP